MTDLRRRLRRLEDMLGSPPGIQIIRIGGGLPGGGEDHASVGPLRFQRQPGELQELFEYRVIEAAIEIGSPFGPDPTFVSPDAK